MAQFVLVVYEPKHAQLLESPDAERARFEGAQILSQEPSFASGFGGGEGDELDDDALLEGVDSEFGETWDIFPLDSSAAGPSQIASSLRRLAKSIDTTRQSKDSVVARLDRILRAIR